MTVYNDRYRRNEHPPLVLIGPLLHLLPKRLLLGLEVLQLSIQDLLAVTESLLRFDTEIKSRKHISQKSRMPTYKMFDMS